MKVLIVEDDPNIRMALKFALKKEGFICEEADNGKTALEKTAAILPDVILLDIKLPEKDGYAVCKEIRESPDYYGDPLVLMLTSKGEKEDIIKGLTRGADEYMKKPYDDDELILRIRALMRRKKVVSGSGLRYKELVIDEEQNKLVERGEEIKVTKRELEFLSMLIRNKGIILSREKLADEIWGEEYDSESRAIDNFVVRMKKKVVTLKDNLESIKGIGYKLASDAGYGYK